MEVDQYLKEMPEACRINDQVVQNRMLQRSHLSLEGSLWLCSFLHSAGFFTWMLLPTPYWRRWYWSAISFFTKDQHVSIGWSLRWYWDVHRIWRPTAFAISSSLNSGAGTNLLHYSWRSGFNISSVQGMRFLSNQSQSSLFRVLVIGTILLQKHCDIGNCPAQSENSWERSPTIVSRYVFILDFEKTRIKILDQEKAIAYRLNPSYEHNTAYSRLEGSAKIRGYWKMANTTMDFIENCGRRSPAEKSGPEVSSINAKMIIHRRNLPTPFRCLIGVGK